MRMRSEGPSISSAAFPLPVSPSPILAFPDCDGFSWVASVTTFTTTPGKTRGRLRFWRSGIRAGRFTSFVALRRRCLRGLRRLRRRRLSRRSFRLPLPLVAAEEAAELALESVSETLAEGVLGLLEARLVIQIADLGGLLAGEEDLVDLRGADRTGEDRQDGGDGRGRVAVRTPPAANAP